MPPVGRHSAVRIARPKWLDTAGLLMEVADQSDGGLGSNFDASARYADRMDSFRFARDTFLMHFQINCSSPWPFPGLENRSTHHKG